MDPLTAVMAFSVAAALLTITPGLDTALVLRTAAVEGGRQAMLAGGGISLGSVLWGCAAALGLGMVLALSETAYLIVQIAGAAYLLYLGGGMLKAAIFHRPAPIPSGQDLVPSTSRKRNWFVRGLLTNLLNPKVGAFYMSFLPQFIPAGSNIAAFSVMLAAIHAVMGLLWFAALVLATRPLSGLLRRPIVTRALDGVTGAALIAFGLRLALEKRS